MDSPFQIKDGTIINATEKYIVHQIQAAPTSNYLVGITREIFEKYPYADCYKNPKIANFRPLDFAETYISQGVKDEQFFAVYWPKPGVLTIEGDGISKRFVINLFGQELSKGALKMLPQQEAVLKKQEIWFQEGLNEIYKIPELESVAFQEILEETAKKNSKIKTALYVEKVVKLKIT